MPDEKKTEDTGIISPSKPDSGSGLAGSGRKKNIPGKTPLALTLMIGFVICSLAVLAIMALPGLRDTFEGDTAFWILRVVLIALIAAMVIYFLVRERANVRYAQSVVEQMTESNTRLTMLLQAERDIGSTLELEDALEYTLTYASWSTGAQFGAIYLWDKSEEVLKASKFRGVDDRAWSGRAVALGEGLVGGAAAERTLLVSEGPSSRSGEDNIFAGAAAPASQVAVPMEAGDRLVGVLVMANAEPHHYTAEEKNMLSGIAELASLTMKNAELYRIARRSLDAAARQREAAGLVVDEMSAGVLTVNSRGRVTIFNREAQRLTGHSLDDVTTLRLQAGVPLEQSPFGQIGQAIIEAISDGEAAEGKAVVLRKDRTLLPVVYKVSPLVEGSEILGATAVFIEEKQLAPEPAPGESVDFQLLLRSLGSRIERLYTHPLSRVIEHVRAMDLDVWSRSRDEVVRVLEVGSHALMGLLEDVEHYLNCVTSREWDEPTECDLSSIVAEVVDDVLRRPEARGVVAAVNLAGLPPAFGYERMVRSALEQVLINSCIASASGGRRVEVGGSAGGGFVRVNIKDTGPGVPTDIREAIFNPFYTSVEGHSGMGLAIVKRVMERLGGTVGLADSDTGALFFLEFPTSRGLAGNEHTAGVEGG